MPKNISCAYGFIIILLVQYLFPAHAILDAIDFLSLQSIRKSFSDLPGSNYFASWDFTSDPCTFSGVSCDEDGVKVISLNLGETRAGSPGLSGRVDPAIGNLSSLFELTIVPGRVIGRLPHTLSQLTSLRFLAITGNFLSGEIPASLGQLRELQTLDLSYNHLTGNLPPAIGALPALSNVVLSHNWLTDSVPSFVSKTLIRLDLKNNDFSGPLDPHGLPPSLEYLSLSRNLLTGRVDRSLYHLNRLNYVDLSLNLLTGRIPANLFSFPIKNLYLNRNRFSGQVKPDGQVTIPTVDLSFNRLSGEISPFFSTVEGLYLNNNRFTGQVPGSLVSQLLSGSIQVLYLHHNYLTGIEIDPKAEIPSSSSFCLQYNCMVLPVETPCPWKAGKQKTRPKEQCKRRKG